MSPYSFTWISSVGEETMGEVTMVSPDNSQVCHRYRCTRSFTYDYKCSSCVSKHSVLAPDTITILISDQHAPDSMPPNADGSCTLIIRLFGITIEDLCFLSLGPLNEKGANWEGWRAFGVSELLIKCLDQGKRVFLAVVSGTEAVEGGPVSYTNSEQTVFSQFHGKGLYMKNLVHLISFPSPLQGIVKHELRDSEREPIGSIVADLNYEATMSASESHCHDVPVPVSKVLVQRSQTTKVYREVYKVSKLQSALRACQSWVVKKKIEFSHNSRFPKMAQRVTMDANRGTRMTQDRLLSDLTPCPGYVTEWSVAFHADMMTGGALNISKEDAKYLHDLKKITCRFYAKNYNILADQREYTLALYRYMLNLGSLVKGDFLCVNQLKHDKVKVFDTEELMRNHWKDCHQIQVEEIYLPMLVPDMLREPGMPRLNLQGGGGTQPDLPGPSGTQGVLPGPGVVTPVLPGTNPGPVSRTAQLTKKEMRALAKAAARQRLENEGKSEAPKSVSGPSVTMDSETATESAAGSTTGDKVVFTAVKGDDIDVDETALAHELATYEEK